MAQTLPNGQIKVEAGDTLSGIYGADWQKLSGYTGDPTKLQIGTILPAKPTMASPTPPTTPTAPISPTMPANAPQYQMPDISKTTDMGTIVKGVTRMYNLQPQGPATTENDSLVNDIKSLMAQDTGKEAYTQQEEEALGVNQTQKDLSDINAQILALQTNQQAQELQIGKEPISSGAIQGRDIELERNNAITALTLSAKKEALQGNLDFANQQVKKAVDLKYKDLEAQIAQKQQLLDLNRPAMTAEQKKQADIISTALETQRANIATKKDTDNQIQQLAIKALSNGAPLSVANAIQNSPDVNSAIQTAGRYLETPLNEKRSEETVNNTKIPSTPEEKAFNSDLQSQLDALAKGGSWGDTYNFLANRYGVDYPELTKKITELNSEEKKQYAELLSKAVSGDETLLDIILGKSRYYSQS